MGTGLAVFAFIFASTLMSSGVFVLLPPAGWLQAQPSTTGPTRVRSNSLGVETSAPVVLVLDQLSGSELYAGAADRSVPIASITKLLTALTWLSTNPDLSERITITDEDVREGGREVLVPGDTLPARDVLALMLVSSSNEAAVALARSVGTETFVRQMNQTARSLGMERSWFVEPTGLDPNNRASARDVAKLATAAFADPTVAPYVTTQEWLVVSELGREITGRSTDLLLSSFLNTDDYEIIGAKTGSLDEAGYCLVLSISKNGHAVLAVLLGSTSPANRWQDAKALIDWTFRNYEWNE